MRKYYFLLRVIGYIILWASFDKQGIPVYYIIILALVMELTILINHWLNKYNVSDETRDEVEDMMDDIDINIKDKENGSNKN